MIRFYKALGWIFLMAALFGTGVLPAAAQTTSTSVGFSPDTLQLAIGEIREVVVEIRDVADLYGFDLTVKFDSTVLEIQDAVPRITGTQVAQGIFLDPGLIAANSVDNLSGKVHFVMTQTNPSAPKSGSGVLVVLKVKALKAGSTTLSVDPVLLSSAAGQPIIASVVNGTVDVLAATPQVAQPTPTPLPVQDDSQYIPTAAPTTPVTPTVTSAAAPTQAAVLPSATPILAASSTPAAGTFRINTPRAVITSTPLSLATPTAAAQPTSLPESTAGSKPALWMGGIGGVGLIALSVWMVGKRRQKL